MWSCLLSIASRHTTNHRVLYGSDNIDAIASIVSLHNATVDCAAHSSEKEESRSLAASSCWQTNHILNATAYFDATSSYKTRPAETWIRELDSVNHLLRKIEDIFFKFKNYWKRWTTCLKMSSLQIKNWFWMTKFSFGQLFHRLSKQTQIAYCRWNNLCFYVKV